MLARAVSLLSCLGLCLLGTSSPVPAQEGPRSLDPRLKIELFAEQPRVVTPTGLDVDVQGRVLVIESHTHFPPAGYAGHDSDRLLLLTDANGDGRADDSPPFADGFRHAMSVLALPPWVSDQVELKPAPNGRQLAVLVATRRAIWLLHDDDGDGHADRRRELLTLITPGDYPHNGLAGFALDPLDWLYFGFGENLGAEYTLKGSDGTALSGGGEGGNLYLCRLDGSGLQQVATGFWNPHASAIDPFGRLFTDDNDPDSRPPCRLLSIWPGADFGYRFRNGRKGLHPFTAWNGEIAGTVPMTAGTGEAPSGIVACESSQFPAGFAGQLLVTSWGDHRIDRFELKPRGSAWQSLAEPLITGPADFRPVGLAFAPDGSLYCSDWVKPDYNVHGSGRVWKISAVEKPPATATDRAPLPPAQRVEPAALVAALADPHPPRRRAAARQLATTVVGREALREVAQDRSAAARARHEAFWAVLQQAQSPAFTPGDQARLLQPDSGLAPVAAAQLGTPSFPAQPTLAGKLARHLLNERLGGRAPKSDQSALLPALAGSQLEDRQLVALALSIDDPAVFATLVETLARHLPREELLAPLLPGSQRPAKWRLASLLAARRQDSRRADAAELGLADGDPQVRRAAVQWAAEERLTDLRSVVDGLFASRGMTPDLFLATLAASQMLAGTAPTDIDKTPAAQVVLPLIADAGRSADVRAQALRLVSPSDEALTAELFDALWGTGQPLLRREALRTWQLGRAGAIADRLLPLAEDSQAELKQRLDAAVALTGIPADHPQGATVTEALRKLVLQADTPLAIEGLRSLRSRSQPAAADLQVLSELTERLLQRPAPWSDADEELAEQVRLLHTRWKRPLPAGLAARLEPRPSTREEWVAALGRGRGGDHDAGRRIFYHPQGPLCARCHTVNGRGGRVGPDLTRVSDSLNR
ncbi:MAG: PVC-type heme-binding CxxCH protein, partial [Planctomycetaceae bacterium]